jgi:hypothetical protein
MRCRSCRAGPGRIFSFGWLVFGVRNKPTEKMHAGLKIYSA